MKGEIDRDFYCAANYYDDSLGFIPVCKDPTHDGSICDYCRYHAKHKWPTPEQFKEEYGEEYTGDSASYLLDFTGDGKRLDWWAYSYADAKILCGNGEKQIVCACTPRGKPSADWRPE